jgi:2-hydroxychromene-2-carboxylate isomerase
MSTPALGRTAEWFFDFVSPFAYLQLEQFDTLPASLTIEPKPIVLGALLNHWGQKGPAEIAAKRVFTYRQALYRAQRLGIDYRMPPAHPFNPIKALRLAIAMGGSLDVVQRIFRYIWRDGREVSSPEGFAALCEAMGYAQGTEAVEAATVKEALRRNTERAISLEVFGVPTFALDGNLFWGEDATDLFLECVASRDWLESPEVRRVTQLPIGAQRSVAASTAASTSPPPSATAPSARA